MSYILDALKKANAEREIERGIAPSLHNQPLRAVSGAPAQIGVALKKHNALLLALVAALFLCAVTLSALFWSRPQTPAQSPTPPQTPTPLSAPQTANMAPPIVANPSQTTLSTTTVPIVTPRVPAAPVSVTPAPYKLPPPKVVSTAPAKADPPTALPRPPPRPVPTQATPPAQSAPSPLPASVRAALPPLVITGSTYSDNPAYRMLIINGQVYREGEFPAPDLQLAQIRPKSALLQYKGNTYVLPY